MKNKVLTKKEIREIIEAYAIKTRIQLGYPKNYEVAEVPIETLSKVINKIQKSKIIGDKYVKEV